MQYRIKQRRFKANYVKVYNSLIRDKNLSLRAKGLHIWMQNQGDDFHFTIRSMATIHGTGKDTIRTCLNELIREEYLQRYEEHDPQTGYRIVEYVVFPVKVTEFRKYQLAMAQLDEENEKDNRIPDYE